MLRSNLISLSKETPAQPNLSTCTHTNTAKQSHVGFSSLTAHFLRKSRNTLFWLSQNIDRLGKHRSEHVTTFVLVPTNQPTLKAIVVASLVPSQTTFARNIFLNGRHGRAPLSVEHEKKNRENERETPHSSAPMSVGRINPRSVVHKTPQSLLCRLSFF